jgi:endonuclease G
MTLSIPATAQTVISVAAIQKSKPPFTLYSASSHGPTRDGREKPELAAPGHGIMAAASGTKSGIVSGEGTSTAAPHVTGAVALLLSRQEMERLRAKGAEQFNGVQVRSALIRSVQNFDRSRVPGLGFGVLDVANFITTLVPDRIEVDKASEKEDVSTAVPAGTTEAAGRHI